MEKSKPDMILGPSRGWLCHSHGALRACTRLSAARGTGGNMCGIVGYIGSREISSVLVDGLKRRECRGYDSCGVAIIDEGKPRLSRPGGRIGTPEEKTRRVSLPPRSVRVGRCHLPSAGPGRPG